MWEFFWFVLGALVYSILFRFHRVYEKAKFIQDIKVIAFILIGRAFEALIFSHALKYKLLNDDPDMDNEKIKLFKNNDDAFLVAWKNETVEKLNSAVPPLYKSFLELDSWQDMMDILDMCYKKGVKHQSEKKYQRDER